MNGDDRISLASRGLIPGYQKLQKGRSEVALWRTEVCLNGCVGICSVFWECQVKAMSFAFSPK